MSIQMVGWVLDQDISDPIGKLCLISIANAHNNTTGQCNPSYNVIAKEASCERRTALRKIKWLQEQGYLSVSENKKGSINGANTYRILQDKGGDFLTLGGSDTLSPCSDTPDTRGGDTSVTHNEPEIRTRNKKKINKKDILLEVLNDETAIAVIEHRTSLRKPLTPRAARLLVNELQKTPDPNAAADEMILRGWQSFKADWGVKDGMKQPQSENKISGTDMLRAHANGDYL